MKFSIILTTINRLDDLRRFFDSLRRQTHSQYEVFVVDHELDTRTIAILEEFEQFMPISYLGSASGHSKALNIGLRR